MDPLFDELQCPVCLELFSCPVILPCSHVLCRSPCAERLLNHGFVRCPVCRDNSYISDGVQSLPRVISLENIISRLKHPRSESDVCRPGDVPCQLCQQVRWIAVIDVSVSGVSRYGGLLSLTSVSVMSAGTVDYCH